MHAAPVNFQVRYLLHPVSWGLPRDVSAVGLKNPEELVAIEASNGAFAPLVAFVHYLSVLLFQSIFFCC